jgi:hypothetical protein
VKYHGQEESCGGDRNKDDVAGLNEEYQPMSLLPYKREKVHINERSAVQRREE